MVALRGYSGARLSTGCRLTAPALGVGVTGIP